MSNLKISASLVTFILADLGDKHAAHAVRMEVVRQHYVSALKGNNSQLVAATKELAARKEKIAKAYVAAFNATGIPARAKYEGRCTDEVMETIVMPQVNDLMLVWEIAFLQLMPLETPQKTDEEKAQAKAERAAKKQQELEAFAAEQGYVKPETLTIDNAFSIVQAALPKLAVSELQRLESIVGNMLMVLGRIDTSEAPTTGALALALQAAKAEQAATLQ